MLTSDWKEEHLRIRRLLASRCIVSGFLTWLLEFQLLFIFLLYHQFDVAHPLNSSLELLLSLDDFSNWIRVLFLGVFGNAYGLILSKMHQKFPTRFNSGQELIAKEAPTKICLLSVLIGWSYCAIWMYLSILNNLDINLDVSYTRSYLLFNGFCCGIYFYCAEHGRLGGGLVWPLAGERDRQDTYYWLMWKNIQFSFYKTIVPTVVPMLLYWPNMSGNFKDSWSVFSLCCCLNLMVTTQLHGVKRIYGFIMQRKLPLVVQDNEGMRILEEKVLSFALVLKSTTLHGFQLQAAKDFSDMMANPRSGEYYQIFQSTGYVANIVGYWEELRDVLVFRILAFINRMEDFLHPTTKASCINPQKREYTHRGLRPLMKKPERPRRNWSCRCCMNHALCRRDSIWQRVKLLWNYWLEKLKHYFSNYLKRLEHLTAPFSPKQNPLQYELDCNLSIFWLMKGLVNICKRSCNEERLGVIPNDLEVVFQLLIKLRDVLSKVPPCDSLKTLSDEMKRSIHIMLCCYGPYLSYIITDENLRGQLQDLFIQQNSQ